MGQTSDQIATHIDQTREDLKSNLEELEARVKSVTDWRGHIRKHPMPMVIAALVGGVLLSVKIAKRSPSRQRFTS